MLQLYYQTQLFLPFFFFFSFLRQTNKTHVTNTADLKLVTKLVLFVLQVYVREKGSFNKHLQALFRKLKSIKMAIIMQGYSMIFISYLLVIYRW